MRRAPGSNIGVQTSVVPVTLQRANTATPAFTVPMVPTDTLSEFSLRVLDNHGVASTNPAVVHVMVKHNLNIGTAGGNTLGSTVIQPQQQQQPIVLNNNAINPPTQLKSFPPNSSPQKGSPTSQNTFPSGVP